MDGEEMIFDHEDTKNTKEKRRTSLVFLVTVVVPILPNHCWSIVLKIRSPASPKPGTMNLRSFKSGSIWQT